MYVSLNTIVGASCGIVVWVIVIAYFCSNQRPRLTQDMIILDMLTGVYKPEMLAEEELRKSFAKSKGSNKALYLGNDMQRTFQMKGHWLMPNADDWDEENIKEWSEENSNSLRKTPSQVIVLDNFDSSDDLSELAMRKRMFTSTFGKYPIVNQEHNINEPGSVSSCQSDHATPEQRSDQVTPEEMSTTSSRNSIVQNIGFSKAEERLIILKLANMGDTKTTLRSTLNKTLRDESNTFSVTKMAEN